MPSFLVSALLFHFGAASVAEIQQSKIINGEPVENFKYSWLVAMEKKLESGEFVQYCGGTLLDKNTVITAAHCSVGRVAKNMRVVAHRFDLNVSEKEESSLEFDVDQIVIHPTYEPGIGAKNPFPDAAIWKVSLKPEYDPANIPVGAVIGEESLYLAGTNLAVAGWGKTESGKHSDKLLYVDIPIVPREDCTAAYPTLDRSEFCAGFLDGHKDSCNGDSGGPLFYPDKVPKLVGLVSWGSTPCGLGPGVYTDVHLIKDWIESHRGSLQIDNNSMPIKSNSTIIIVANGTDTIAPIMPVYSASAPRTISYLHFTLLWIFTFATLFT